jgi:hypothetical protein
VRQLYQYILEWHLVIPFRHPNHAEEVQYLAPLVDSEAYESGFCVVLRMFQAPEVAVEAYLELY